MDWPSIMKHGAALARAADPDALRSALGALGAQVLPEAEVSLQLAPVSPPSPGSRPFPLMEGETTLGALWLTLPPATPTLPAEVAAVLEFAATQAAAALASQALVRRLRDRERQLDRKVLDLENLFAVASELNTSLRAGQIAKVLLLNALGLIQASRGAVGFFKGQTYIVLASRGLPAGAQLDVPPLSAEASELESENGDFYLGLVSHGKPLGFLMLGARPGRPYQRAEVDYVRAVADHAAIALENANSYQKIGEMNVSLEAMVQKRTAELETALKELKRAQAQLVQSEKMASLGQMVAGVAHELNNPLTFIHGNLKVLGGAIADVTGLLALVDQGASAEAIARTKDAIDYDYLLADLPKIVDSALNGALRAQKIVEDLKLFSGHDEAEIKPTDLKTGLESAIALVQGRFAERIRFELDLEELPPVTASGKQLNQAFLALLTNACQAIAEAGTVSVRLSHEGAQAVVTIRDTGCGIPDEHQPRIFDPFFTTRPIGEGTGLGLTTAYSVIERHQGRLLVRSRPGEGTTATVRLPLAGVQSVGA